MTISVIFPSRGRPSGLAAAIHSLQWQAARAGQLEIIVAVDPDDHGAAAAAQSVSAHVWVAPERYGYNRLHEYLNPLAKLATGTWLMWWNDDMRMQTSGWDLVIAHHPRPAVLWPRANHQEGYGNICPIWPEAWSDATGRASPVMHLDTYWQRVGQALGRHDPVDIKIRHERSDLTGGQCNDDATYAEGRKLLGPDGMVPGWDEMVFTAQVNADAAVIRRLL